jgi:hypothetical protein
MTACPPNYSLVILIMFSCSRVLSGVLEQYRQQLRFAEDEASSCERRQEHLTAIAAATSALAAPRRRHPRGHGRAR